MCGIFGVIHNSSAGITISGTQRIMDRLFILSESRGKEAAGIARLHPESIQVAKYSEPASSVVGKGWYRDIFLAAGSENSRGEFQTCIMGHSRLVTNGGQQIHANNQPAIGSGMVAVHNGIITNVDELWHRHTHLHRTTQLDTEVFLALLRYYYNNTNSIQMALAETYRSIEGAASIAVYFEDLDCILLATNTGSLYLGINKENSTVVFASEKYILSSLKKSRNMPKAIRQMEIRQVQPGKGLLIDLGLSTLDEFGFWSEGNQDIQISAAPVKRKITDISAPGRVVDTPVRIPGEGPYILSPGFKDEFPRNKDAIDKLRRCTRCVLPETMPFIEFDEKGVCNYCRNYHPRPLHGMDKLMEDIAPFRSKDEQPDCLVTFSGGRDSSYGLHVVKQVLGLNPVAYTYDWGMVTDLGRRNQYRICGKLGIEHILVSADIAKKRANIRANVLAWLKQPDLGTIPLFMAGDKQYFYYANKVGKQTGCKLVILCENLLETTNFKSGFCGIHPRFGSDHTYTLTWSDRVKLAMYYANQYLTNPGYINRSLLDTLGAYASYYVIPHNYLNIYQYIRWDEEIITPTLAKEYNWETAGDTKTTWRIGDGTAAFYNYIYYTMAGLTENDTFRSNQIREGMITREKALMLVLEDSQPRYESMQWYCDIIGIDFYNAIRMVNNAPKRYCVG